MSNNYPDRVSISLDVLTLAAFEKFIRDGLVASGAVSEADNNNFTVQAEPLSVEIDAQSAAKLSQFLLEGLVASGAVSEADNDNVAIALRRVNEGS